jgi:acyl-CoA synthetase (AMP-forming)/AMP-acid ligase II
MWPYPEVKNVGDFARFNARRNPEKPALLFGDNITTMAELDTLSNQCANGLVAAGVQPGERVAFYGSNSDDFLIALLGTAKASACLMPLNWRLSEPELVEVLRDAAPVFAMVTSELKETLVQVQTLGDFDFAVQEVTPGDPAADPLRHWLASFSDSDPCLPCGLDDIAWLLYTSGTSGVPKGVQLTHGGVMMMRLCEHLEPAYTWSADDTYMFATPNFHLLGIGLTLQAFYNGATIAIIAGFEPNLLLQEIERKRPTILGVAPVMIQMMLAVPQYKSIDFSSIREVVYAGSAISLGLIKQAIEVMPCRFMQFYGSTESGGAITLLRPEEHDLDSEQRLTSCGKPLPLIEIKVMDPKGNELPQGTAGEMWVRTPSITIGYRGLADAWSEVFENGWFKTGDVAYVDSQGFFYIVDRIKDMIVTGGENVYCSEVENCLSLHPAVQNVAVIGVPSERWGEEVKACIVLNSGFAENEAELLTYAKENLAGYKSPKSVDYVMALPVGGTGKVLKKELRAPYWEGHSRKV